MVQPGELQLHLGVRGLQHIGDHVMHADRHVTQADDFRLGIARNGFGHDTRRVGKVDDPGIGCQLFNLAGDIQHHRDGA